MGPAGGRDAIHPTIIPCDAGLGHILPNADPFVKRHADRVKGAEVMHKAVIDLFIVLFGDKGAKHLVPYNKDTGIVAVEIARIATMMNAVMAGRIHDGFKPAGHFADGFGVNPELIDKVQPAAE